MASRDSVQYAAKAAGTKLDGRVFGGKLRHHRVDVTFASDAAADTINLMHKPRGECFVFGLVTVDTSTGSATFSIGITGTTAKYRALAAYTSTDLPQLFGKLAPMQETEAATAGEDLILTWAAASAPASGNMVIDFFTSAQ